MAFVHLRAHTEFSVVDGTLRIDDAVAAAAADGQGALAITDLSNLFGAVKFFTPARRAAVKNLTAPNRLLRSVMASAPCPSAAAAATASSIRSVPSTTENSV